MIVVNANNANNNDDDNDNSTTRFDQFKQCNSQS